MQYDGNPRHLPIRDGRITLNWSALGKYDRHSKIGLVWKFQLIPQRDLGSGHTVTLTASFRSGRRLIVHDGERVQYIVRESRERSYAWQMDGHSFAIQELPEGARDISRFRFVIDGTFSFTMPKGGTAFCNVSLVTARAPPGATHARVVDAAAAHNLPRADAYVVDAQGSQDAVLARVVAVSPSTERQRSDERVAPPTRSPPPPPARRPPTSEFMSRARQLEADRVLARQLSQSEVVAPLPRSPGVASPTRGDATYDATWSPVNDIGSEVHRRWLRERRAGSRPPRGDGRVAGRPSASEFLSRARQVEADRVLARQMSQGEDDADAARRDASQEREARRNSELIAEVTRPARWPGALGGLINPALLAEARRYYCDPAVATTTAPPPPTPLLAPRSPTAPPLPPTAPRPSPSATWYWQEEPHRLAAHNPSLVKPPHWIAYPDHVQAELEAARRANKPSWTGPTFCVDLVARHQYNLRGPRIGFKRAVLREDSVLAGAFAPPVSPTVVAPPSLAQTFAVQRAALEVAAGPDYHALRILSENVTTARKAHMGYVA